MGSGRGGLCVVSRTRREKGREESLGVGKTEVIGILTKSYNYSGNISITRNPDHQNKRTHLIAIALV